VELPSLIGFLWLAAGVLKFEIGSVKPVLPRERGAVTYVRLVWVVLEWFGVIPGLVTTVRLGLIRLCGALTVLLLVRLPGLRLKVLRALSDRKGVTTRGVLRKRLIREGDVAFTLARLAGAFVGRRGAEGAAAVCWLFESLEFCGLALLCPCLAKADWPNSNRAKINAAKITLIFLWHISVNIKRLLSPAFASGPRVKPITTRGAGDSVCLDKLSSIPGCTFPQVNQTLILTILIKSKIFVEERYSAGKYLYKHFFFIRCYFNGVEKCVESLGALFLKKINCRMAFVRQFNNGNPLTFRADGFRDQVVSPELGYRGRNRAKANIWVGSSNF